MRYPGGRRLLLCAVLALGVAGGRAAAGEEPTPAARWASVQAEAVKRLHAIADGCTTAKLFGLRAEVYETLLLLAPDDETARRWCRYKRTGEGWTRPPSYKPPRDHGRDRAALEARVSDWRSWFVSEAAATATDAKARRQNDLSREIFRLALDVAPDDVLLHAANGEVRYERGGLRSWVLKDTFSALRRRPALREIAARAVEHPPEPETRPPSGDALDSVPGAVVWQGPHVRLLGASPEEERRTLYARCEAVWPVFETAFGMEAPAWTADVEGAQGLTVVVYDDPEAALAWLARIPGVTEEQVEFARPLAAVAVPRRPAILVLGSEAGIRLEAGPRMILDSMCRTQLGISVDQAWISEGLNHYLSFQITGTRLVGTLSAFVEKTRPADGGPTPQLPTVLPGDDWLAAGRAMMEGDAKPDFRLLVGKPLQHLTPAETLYGYCVAAWLLEGVPDRAAAFLEAVGRGKAADVERLVGEHFLLDVEGFEARLLRWLDETVDLSTPPMMEPGG